MTTLIAGSGPGSAGVHQHRDGPGLASPGTGARVLRGGLAGLLATAVMSAVMLAAGRVGLMGRQPPRAIVERATEVAAERATPPPRAHRGLAVAAHLAFGAGTGAAYALLPPGKHPLTRGIACGLGVYLVAYQGWVPVLGALPAASDDRRDRVATMVAAHVVYGAVLGHTEGWLRARRPAGSVSRTGAPA